VRLRGYYKGKLTRIGRSATDAEDLVQEVLLAIHTQRHTYDPTEPFTPWMHAIARYKLIDYLRTTRAALVDLPIDDAREVVARDDHVGVESAFDLDRLLSRLPQRMRHVIQCVKLQGLSAAEQCEMSESAVKVNVHRALRTLAAAVARESRE
jgi:RNA polymerase sigma-70 factor (ECF subfamily)